MMDNLAWFLNILGVGGIVTIPPESGFFIYICVLVIVAVMIFSYKLSDAIECQLRGDSEC